MPTSVIAVSSGGQLKPFCDLDFFDRLLDIVLTENSKKFGIRNLVRRPRGSLCNSQRDLCLVYATRDVLDSSTALVCIRVRLLADIRQAIAQSAQFALQLDFFCLT